jgi:hypothetical protein
MQVEQRLKLLGFSTMLAAAVMADAACAADAYNGAQIARRWCEPCHVVAGDQRGTTGEAPPFASIAKKPGFDAGQVAMFLLDPHPKDRHHINCFAFLALVRQPPAVCSGSDSLNVAAVLRCRTCR